MLKRWDAFCMKPAALARRACFWRDVVGMYAKGGKLLEDSSGRACATDKVSIRSRSFAISVLDPPALVRLCCSKAGPASAAAVAEHPCARGAQLCSLESGQFSRPFLNLRAV